MYHATPGAEDAHPTGLDANFVPAIGVPGEPTATMVRAVSEMAADLDDLSELAKQLLGDSSYTIAPFDFDCPADFKLSIVIPVYNEEATIHEVVGRVASIPCNKEIILVDDCSRDRSRELLGELAGKPFIKVIFQKKNQGKGAALRTGFAHATGTVIIVQDADLEYDPRDIPKVIRPIAKGEADVVYGSRFLGASTYRSWIHRCGNSILTCASNLTTGLKLTDMETCYKAFRRETLEGIEIEQNRFGFEPEITAKLSKKKLRFTEVPISYDARSYDEGKKIGVQDLFNAFYCIAKYGFRASSMDAPTARVL
jgi:glycosyltransferase involved in cell wall biosynthesis